VRSKDPEAIMLSAKSVQTRSAQAAIRRTSLYGIRSQKTVQKNIASVADTLIAKKKKGQK